MPHFLLLVHWKIGHERTEPVRTLVQKLRAGEQFLVRGRVLFLPDASGTDVDGRKTGGSYKGSFYPPSQRVKYKRVRFDVL